MGYEAKLIFFYFIILQNKNINQMIKITFYLRGCRCVAYDLNAISGANAKRIHLPPLGKFENRKDCYY